MDGRTPSPHEGERTCTLQTHSRRGATDLAGPVDVALTFRTYETECRDTVITSLLGGTPAAVPDHDGQASAITLLPLGIPQVIVVGSHDESRRCCSSTRT